MKRWIRVALPLTSLLLGALAACAGFGTEPAAVTPDVDAGGDAGEQPLADATTSDGPDASPRLCDPHGAFQNFKRLASLSSDADDLRPSVTEDELTLVFHRGESSQGRILLATRLGREAEFGVPTEIAGLADPTNRPSLLAPAISGDGLHLAFAVLGGADDSSERIWFAHRSSGTQDFEAPVNATELNGPGKYNTPAFRGSRLYFSSDRDGPVSIYQADSSAGVYSASSAVKDATLVVQRPLEGTYPTPSADGRYLYFARLLAGTGLRIFIADLDDSGSVKGVKAITTSTGDSFNTVAPGAGGPSVHELPGAISRDHCRLYFASKSPAGNIDLYVGTR